MRHQEPLKMQGRWLKKSSMLVIRCSRKSQERLVETWNTWRRGCSGLVRKCLVRIAQKIAYAGLGHQILGAAGVWLDLAPQCANKHMQVVIFCLILWSPNGLEQC